MNLCCTETLHTGTGKLPRFHPVCLRQKTILIHVMITESPCRIKAAPRWYSVSRNIRIFTPYRSLSEMTGQLTVLFNTFIIIFTLQRLFYIKIRMSVKPETASKRRIKMSTLNSTFFHVFIVLPFCTIRSLFYCIFSLLGSAIVRLPLLPTSHTPYFRSYASCFTSSSNSSPAE